METASILVLVGVACFVLAVVSGYLIYRHVQDEKEQVYKARVRRQKYQLGPSEYLQQIHDNKPKEPALAGPSAVVLETKKDSHRVPIPGQALDLLPTKELEVTPEPAPAPKEPADDIDFISPKAMVAPVALLGNVATGSIQVSPPHAYQKNGNPATLKTKTRKAPKKEKRPSDVKNVQDFEEYGNFSHTHKSVPPPRADGLHVKCVAPPISPDYQERVNLSLQAGSTNSNERLKGLDFLSQEREGLGF